MQRNDCWSLSHTRLFAAESTSQRPGQQDQASTSGGGQGQEETNNSNGVDHMTAELQAKEKALEGLQTQVNDLTESFKRSLAEMENLRQRTSRQIDNAQKFAIQGFAKNLLDVADDLQRAAESVPPEVLKDGSKVQLEKALGLLKSLLQGVNITERNFLRLLEKNGIEQFNPMGHKFDPHLHDAKFEVPDATKEPGTVVFVSKRGYKMHDRVLRAAEVGVSKGADKDK
eukprot:jgi/Chrzof1/11050/Cz05g21220.t1